MATPTSERNGLISQRRLSRAYDQPVVQHTSKGNMVRHDLDSNSSDSSLAALDCLGNRFEAVGGIIVKGTLASVAVVGALVGVMGEASLKIASQFFGFMLMLCVTFMACVGSFYWWGTSSQKQVSLSVKKVIVVYALCISSDVLARLIRIFTDIPPTSGIPTDASYFISFATILLLLFSLFVHNEGLNAMFSQESIFFVVCTVILNFSSICLFGEILPHIVLSHMVYVGLLLGLSVALAGYRFPKISPSGIYWMMSQTAPSRPVVHVKPSSVTARISMDNSLPHSRRDSYSSTSSKMHRASFSSISSINSAIPQSFDGEVASEAHGLLTELLYSKEALPSDTYQKLRRIKDILAPRMEKLITHPRVHVGSLDHDDHDYESDVSSVSSFRLGNHLTVQKHHRKNRSTSVIQLRRSTTKFATTTTASGMPVLENEPMDRARSLALRDVKARISVQEKRHSVHRMPRERLSSEGRLFPRSLSHEKSQLSKTSFSADLNVSESETSDVDYNSRSSPILFQIGETTSEDVDRQPVSKPPLRHIGKLGSKEDNLEIITEGDELQVTRQRPRSATHEEAAEVADGSDEQKLGVVTAEEEGEREKEKGGAKEREALDESKVFIQEQIGQHKFYSFTRYKRPSQSCDLSEYTSNEHLDMFENVAVWDYPIFELEEKASNHILSHMAHMLFHEAGLMETFKIPQREFVNYFRALEANYGSNVYHNKTHAADVLHAVSYLLFEIIPEFSHEFSQDDDTQREWKGRSRVNGSGGNIASAFSILEVLACYMASAMHDFDHPGRTNAFLVGTRSTLALLYNDRSVLENHHAAASWHLLTNFDENNFLASLDEAEMKRLRFLIIEAILATDLKMHFDILSIFRAKVADEGTGVDWESEMDRMLVMKMLIKMADISTPAKSFDLHRKWTERITEEFYQQSEEEERLALPATIFMDRRHPEKLPAVQLSFIQHLVSPLFQVCAQAGIIPGILEPLPARSSSTPALESTEEKSPGGDTPAVSAVDDQVHRGEGETPDNLDNLMRDTPDPFDLEEDEEEPKDKFMSIILTNLQINYDGWKAELPPEEGEEGGGGEEEGGDKEDGEKPLGSADNSEVAQEDLELDADVEVSDPTPET